MTGRTTVLMLASAIAVILGLIVAVASERLTTFGGLVAALIGAGVNVAIELGPSGPAESQTVDAMGALKDEPEWVQSCSPADATSPSSASPASAAVTPMRDLASYTRDVPSAEAPQCPRCGRFVAGTEGEPHHFDCSMCGHRWRIGDDGTWPRTAGRPAIEPVNMTHVRQSSPHQETRP